MGEQLCTHPSRIKTVPLRQRARRIWNTAQVLLSENRFLAYRATVLQSARFTHHEFCNAASSGLNIAFFVHEPSLAARIQEVQSRSMEFARGFREARDVLETIARRLDFIRFLAKVGRDNDAFRNELRTLKQEVEQHQDAVPVPYLSMIIDSINMSRALLSGFAADVYQEKKEPVMREYSLYEFVNWCKEYFALDSVRVINKGTMPIQVDRFMVGRILENLVVNAEQANAERIEIEFGGENNHAYIRVMDDGDGIIPELIERVFEPGFTTKRKKGHGFGLAISREIAEIHQGTLTAASNQNQNPPRRGMTFELTLPISNRN